MRHLTKELTRKPAVIIIFSLFFASRLSNMASNGECCEAKNAVVKPVDLPIYDNPNVQAKVAKVEEVSAAVEAVKTVRLAINDGFKQVVGAKDQLDHILETGKAHTECKYDVQITKKQD